jgi:hypothetical protein
MKIVNFTKFNESNEEMDDESFLKMIENRPDLDDDSKNIIRDTLELITREKNTTTKSELIEDILLQVGDTLDPDLYKSVEQWLKKK